MMLFRSPAEINEYVFSALLLNFMTLMSKTSPNPIISEITDSQPELMWSSFCGAAKQKKGGERISCPNNEIAVCDRFYLIIFQANFWKAPSQAYLQYGWCNY
jgi:hypothetical protein